MSSIVSRFKALVLTVMALCGLTALMATSAQANWLENGAAIAVNKEVKASAHTEARLLISSLNFEIRCPTLDAESIKLIAGTKEATGSIKFLGCKGFQISTGTVQTKCTPETISGEKEVILAGGKALDVKLATIKGNAASLKEYLLYEPATVGGAFTTLKFPETCALAETSVVKGSLVFECGELKEVKFVGEECGVAQKVHLLQAAVPTTFWKGVTHTEEVKDLILFGENKATVDGIVADELVSGNPWSGDA